MTLSEWVHKSQYTRSLSWTKKTITLKNGGGGDISKPEKTSKPTTNDQTHHHFFENNQADYNNFKMIRPSYFFETHQTGIFTCA